MALDDRDAKFEKALSRHIRAECPDAETLAAYHERSLSSEEMIQWKKHFAGCGACQEILAQLETTEPIPLETNADVGVLVAAQAAARQLEGVGSLAADQGPGAVRDRARKVPAEAIQMPKRGAWRWAAPAGAIAAGLLVWLTVRDMRDTTVVLQGPVAEKRADAGRSPVERNEVAQAKPLDRLREQKAETAEPQSKVKVLAPAMTPRPSPPPSRHAQALNGEVPRTLQQEELKAAETQVGRGLDDKLQANAGALSGTRVETKEPGAAKDEKGALDKTIAPAANKPNLAATETVEVTAEAAAPSEKKRASAEKAAVQPALGLAGGMPSNYKQDAYLRDADSATLHLVPSPDGKAMWRVGPNGLIVKSGEKGSGWKVQVSGVTVELTAGAAASEKVCWLVGQEGTILRTTDGGEHWQKISSPITGDLGGVRAKDAMRAVVWDESNHLGYETSDGGSTWKFVARP